MTTDLYRYWRIASGIFFIIIVYIHIKYIKCSKISQRVVNVTKRVIFWTPFAVRILDVIHTIRILDTITIIYSDRTRQMVKYSSFIIIFFTCGLWSLTIICKNMLNVLADKQNIICQWQVTRFHRIVYLDL